MCNIKKLFKISIYISITHAKLNQYNGKKKFHGWVNSKPPILTRYKIWNQIVNLTLPIIKSSIEH